MCYLRLYIKGRGRGIPSKLVLWSFFPMFVNKLPPGNLSVLLQNQSVHSKDGAEQTVCFLRLYVEGRGRGVPSKLVLWSLFPKFVNKLPPREFISSSLKSVSTVRIRCKTNVVLFVQSEDGAKQMLCSFATLRQRAWPWRAVKVGSVVFFSKVCELSPPRDFISSSLKSVSTVRIRCKTNVVPVTLSW